MRKFLKILLPLLLLVVATNLYSQIPPPPPCDPNATANFPCPNVGCDNPQIPWVQGSYFITIPQFPDCPLRVDFCYRTCNIDPYTVTIRITQINMLYPYAGCVGCNALRSYYQGPNGMKKFILLAWQEVTTKMYTDFVNQHSDKSQFYCPNKKQDYTATLGGCVASCETQTSYVDKNGQVQTAYTLIPVECTDYGCCFYKKSHCVDPVSKEIVISPTTLDTYGEISGCLGMQNPPTWPVECSYGINTIFSECESDCVDPNDL